MLKKVCIGIVCLEKMDNYITNVSRKKGVIVMFLNVAINEAYSVSELTIKRERIMSNSFSSFSALKKD